MGNHASSSSTSSSSVLQGLRREDLINCRTLGSSFGSYTSVHYILSELRCHPNREAVQDAGLQILRNMVDDNVAAGEIVAKAGGTKWIVAAMKRFPDHNTIQQNACEILFVLASMNNALSVTTTPGVATAIVEAMRNHSTHLPIQLMACAALLDLGWPPVNSRIRGEFGTAGGHHTVASTMNQYQDRPWVQESCLLVLVASSRSRSNWKHLTSSPVVAAIMSAFRLYSGSDTIIQNCSTQLLCLILTDQYNNQQFMRKGFRAGVDPMIYVSFCPSKDDNQKALQHVKSHSGRFYPRMIYSSSSKGQSHHQTWKYILEAMTISRKHHCWDLHTCMSSMVALVYVLMNHRCQDNPDDRSTLNDKDDFQNLDALVQIIEATMQDFQSVAFLQAACCLALAAIPRIDYDYCFESLTVLESIVLALTTHKDDSTVQLAALAALMELWGDEENSPLSSALTTETTQAARLGEAVVGTLETHSGDWGIQQFAFIVLTQLFQDNDDMHEEMGVITIVKAAILALNGQSATLACQLDALRVLFRIVSCEHGAGIFVQAGGLAAITKAIKRHKTPMAALEMIAFNIFQCIFRSQVDLTAIEQRLGIEFFVTALSRDWGENTNDYQDKSMTALATFVIKKVSSVFDILEFGGVEAVIQVTSRRKADFHIHYPAFFIFQKVRYYATSDEMEEAICNTACNIVRVMKRGELRNKELASCCWIISQTLETQPTSQRALVEEGGVEALAGALNKTTDNDEGHALQALLTLSSNRNTHEHIVTSGAVNGIVHTMLHHQQCRLIQERGFEILKRLSGKAVRNLLVWKSGGLLAIGLAWARYGDKGVLHQFALKSLWEILLALCWHYSLWRLDKSLWCW